METGPAAGIQRSDHKSEGHGPLTFDEDRIVSAAGVCIPELVKKILESRTRPIFETHQDSLRDSLQPYDVWQHVLRISARARAKMGYLAGQAAFEPAD